MLALESSFVCANTNNHCAYRWSTTHAYARAFSDPVHAHATRTRMRCAGFS